MQILPIPRPPTVADLIDRYFQHAQAVGLFCAEAMQERQRTLGRFRSAYGAMAVDECRAFHLSDWIEDHPEWKSTSTRKAKANQVNAVFNWAVEQGRIGQNPFKSVKYAEADPRPCMPDSVLDGIMLRANKRYERAIRFLRLVGCRLSDLCSATWEGYDSAHQIIRIERHKSRRYTKKPKELVLVAEAVALLAEIRAENNGVCTGPIFLNNRDHPWNRRTLGLQLRRLKMRYAIDTRATLHGLRHQMGTMIIANGGELKKASLLLNHSSTYITERYYVHMNEEMREAVRGAASLGLPRK